MAKPSSSARPASRRIASEVPDASSTAPVRTTRTTRSQSREPAEQGAAIVESTRSRKANNMSKELTIPEEDADIVTADQEAVADDVADDDVTDAPRTHSRASAISGTTAKTTFSQEEIADLDAEVMADVLPNLVAAADEVAQFLVPGDPKSASMVWKEARIPGSRHHKLYSNRLASLKVHKDCFGSQEYIQPTIILRALLGVQRMEEVPTGPWRPDALIYETNLAQMLRSALVTPSASLEVSQEGFDALANLEANFATTIAGPEFDVQAVKTMLAIQTQLSLASVMIRRTQPGLIPRDVIQDIFFGIEDEDDFSYKHAAALHMLDANEEDTTYCNNALDQLVDDLLSTHDVSRDRNTALHSLRTKYPWQTFQGQIIHYFNHRKAQLEHQTRAAGGTDQIARGLLDQVQRAETARIADEMRKSLGKSGTPKKSFPLSAMLKLKAREKKLSLGSVTTPSTAPPLHSAVPTVVPLTTQPQQVPLESKQTPAIGDDGWMGWVDEEQPQSTVQDAAKSNLGFDISGFHRAQGQDGGKGKGRSLIDRQPGAKRIQFDDTQASHVQDENEDPLSSARHTRPINSQRSPGKRPRVDDDEELEDFNPTQDDGFQTAEVDAAAAAGRRRQARASTAPRPPSESAGPSTQLPTRSTAPSPQKRQRKNPGSTVPLLQEDLDADGQLPPASSYYETAKIKAKQRRIRNASAKLPQVRVTWTPEEDEALIDLIVEHGDGGISYAMMKSLDDSRGVEKRLERRRPEDMRFKARNMKETMLLAGVPLPENFKYVVLDRKAMEKLHARGIEYAQQRIRNVASVMDDAFDA